nr:basic proline-rich protein-like [Meriones unguiculatus]
MEAPDAPPRPSPPPPHRLGATKCTTQGWGAGRALRETLPPPAGQCPPGRRANAHRPDLHPPRPRLPHLGREPAAADGVAGSAHPGGAGKPDVGLRGLPCDGLCNRQGPQPGQRRRPRGTSASRAQPAAQPGSSLAAGPCGTALPDDTATILGAGKPRAAGGPLPKPPAAAAEAQESCRPPSRPRVRACVDPAAGRGPCAFRDQAARRSQEASQAPRRFRRWPALEVQWRGTERPTSCEGNQRSTPVRCQLWVPIIRVDCTCGVQGLMLLEYFGVGHEQTG